MRVALHRYTELSWRARYIDSVSDLLDGEIAVEEMPPETGWVWPDGADYPREQTEDELLAFARLDAHAERRALRTRAELGGFTHDNHRFDSDRDSILRITNAAQAATVASMLQMPFSTVWTCADGYQYDVPDAATMLSIHGALVAHGQACHSYSQALADLIEGAVSLEALAAMDLGAGWPG